MDKKTFLFLPILDISKQLESYINASEKLIKNMSIKMLRLTNEKLESK